MDHYHVLLVLISPTLLPSESNQMEDLKLSEVNVGGTLSYTLKNEGSKKQVLRWGFSAAPTSIQIYLKAVYKCYILVRCI